MGQSASFQARIDDLVHERCVTGRKQHASSEALLPREHAQFFYSSFSPLAGAQRVTAKQVQGREGSSKRLPSH